MSQSAAKYLTGVVLLVVLSTISGLYLQGAVRIFICAAAMVGMLYLVAKIAREERSQ
ncbi:hypothetical protein [Actinomyces qiguomingii]|uniref:hypothetical protein n=1 Tax=Actinomyces qiguomingii TaxID=2057800 RepID=UPI0013047E2F|nr:hypothetical protein [Actinomyces qiguomingii]